MNQKSGSSWQKPGGFGGFGGGQKFGFGVPNDKRKLVHGMFMIFGGLMIMKMLFGGARGGGHPAYGGYPGEYPPMQQGPYYRGGRQDMYS
jgi:hypothetical protein